MASTNISQKSRCFADNTCLKKNTMSKQNKTLLLIFFYLIHWGDIDNKSFLLLLFKISF